jgi:predicted RNA methylase
VKYVKMILFCCTSAFVYTNQVPIENYKELVQKLETEGRAAIDTIFNKAREALESGQDIITAEWLDREKIKEIQHSMSNAHVELCFDSNSKNVIPEKMQQYLQSKIREEADKIFEYKNLTSDQASQFFLLSELVCKLHWPINCHSQAIDCSDMIRIIKDENFPCIKNIKIEEDVQRQMKKEERRNLCRAIIFGAVPRQ